MLVELLGEVALLTYDLSRELLRVERELDAEFGVEVDEWVRNTLFVLHCVLSTNLRHHGNASIWKLDVLLVQLKVLFEGILNVFVVEDLAINDVAEILQNHVDLGHG